MLLALLVLGQVPLRLEVGDGKFYHRIEDAVKAAPAGGEVDVFPSSAGYKQTAVRIAKRLTIIAKGHVVLDGTGFDYTGAGSVPRAVFQIEEGGSGTSIEGFKICGARNDTFNGAAIRIISANDVSVRRCEIFGNDMGVMSNGEDRNPTAGANQTFSECNIHENGTDRQPGLNHNLYLGGTSVNIDHCFIWGATTGHNLKSRAHYTQVTNSVLYGGSNRQIDCVDSWNTALPNSNLVVFNCILAMDANSKGNGNVIHFGAEGGKRNGCAYILDSTIYTEFLSPILLLDSKGASARLEGSVFLDPDPMRPELVGLDKGVTPSAVNGHANVVSEGYSFSQTLMTNKDVTSCKVVTSGRTVPPMNSSGFALTLPNIQIGREANFVDGSGTRVQVRLDKPPIWKCGADPDLFSNCSRRLPK